MEDIAYLPYRTQPIITNTIPFKQKLCKYYLAFEKEQGDSKYIDEFATMAQVIPTWENVKLSILKCDAKPMYPNDELQQWAETMSFRHLQFSLTQPIYQKGQELDITTSTSPASFWKEKGCGTKGQALLHSDSQYFIENITTPVICDYNTKVEFLTMHDIVDRNKIRGTFNPPLDFIVKEKLLYDNQNHAMVENCHNSWIKYGFVKQNGGFSKLAEEYKDFEIMDEHDVSGYDRTVFLEPTMRLRNKCLQYPKGAQPLVEYVTANLVRPLFNCPDGVVRQRQTGNISGSNLTTTNNSIAHVLVLMRFIGKLWLQGEKRLPTFEEIFYYHNYSIYSDDALGGHTISHLSISLDDFNAIKVEVFNSFGLNLKLSQTMTTKVVDRKIDPKHSFLGSYFHHYPKLDAYLPYPRVEKLCSAIKYTLEHLQPVDMIAKMVAIKNLSTPVPELLELTDRYLNFLVRKYGNKVPYGLPDEWVSTISVGNNFALAANKELGRESGGRKVLKDYHGSENSNQQEGERQCKAVNSTTSSKVCTTNTRNPRTQGYHRERRLHSEESPSQEASRVPLVRRSW